MIKKIVFYVMNSILLSVFCMAMSVTVQDQNVLSLVNYTFNYTKNSDGSGVLLSVPMLVATNSFGIAQANLNLNNLTKKPSWLMIYNSQGLAGMINVSGYNFKDELVGKPQWYSAWSNVTSDVIASQLVVIQFDVKQRKDFFFDKAGSQGYNVTVLYDGDYVVNYDVSLKVNSGDQATNGKCWIQVNGLDVDGTNSFALHLNSTAGKASYHSSILLSLNSGDIIAVACKSQGSSMLVSIPRASQININYIREAG